MRNVKRGKRGTGFIYRINKVSGYWYIKYCVNGKAHTRTVAQKIKGFAEKILKERLAKNMLGELLPGAAKVTFEEWKKTSSTIIRSTVRRASIG